MARYKDLLDEDEMMFEDEDAYWERKAQEYEDAHHEKADRKYPDLEDRHCWKCGGRLVRGSMSYYEGWHFDSCY